jgi:hypothetical protein
MNERMVWEDFSHFGGGMKKRSGRERAMSTSRPLFDSGQFSGDINEKGRDNMEEDME